nr:hypothetical protein [Tanacetum cinerariifolium]GFA82653.1 hypothetical protein [Tanacetum cinerariifolium]
IWKRIPLSGLPVESGWLAKYGFGHDEHSDDYNAIGLLSLLSDRGMNGTKVKIYLLKSGYWRGIYNFPYDVWGTDISKFSNGALHWLIKVSNSFYHPKRDVSNSLMIASFHLGNETSGEVLQPVYDEGDKDLTLGVLGECLCMICSYGVNYAGVWVMKVYGVKDSWTKLVSIPYLTHPRINRYLICAIKHVPSLKVWFHQF